MIILLEARQPLSLSELSERLEVSRQSVQRRLERNDLTYFGELKSQIKAREMYYSFKPAVKRIDAAPRRLYKTLLAPLKQKPEPAGKNAAARLA